MTTMLKTGDLEFLKKSFQADFPDFGEPMLGNISPTTSFLLVQYNLGVHSI